MSDNQALDTFDGLDYEEIEQAVMETSRGRWFLTEFARRHKAADTAVLLDAIRRLEAQIQSMSGEPDDGAPARTDASVADSSDDGSGYDEIADKLDRTTQLVRRLRSSHKLIGEAADKPLAAAKAAPVKTGSEKPSGDPPGFVGSDDDIFADNNSIVSALQQQAEMPGGQPVNGDTMEFADVEAADTADRQDDAAAKADDASDRPEHQAVPAPATPHNGEQSSTVDDTIKANGRISVTRPTAANQIQIDDEPAAEPHQPVGEPAQAADEPADNQSTAAAPVDTQPAEKPKKRIIVIRRPADQACDIPLADASPETPGDSPTAA